jgi:hypothetical protein
MAGLSALATIGSLAATAVSAVGTIAAGRAQKQAADHRAAQLEVEAKQERATAQQDALAVARKKRLELSRLQAQAAASGFGAADPTVLDLAGEAAKYGTLQQQLARYGGDVRAETLISSAEASRAQGTAAMRNASFNAAGTILGGVSSMFRRYG